MMDSIPGFESKVFAKKQKQLSLLHHKGLAGLRSLLLEKGWMLSIIGFLLGRAVILSTVSPFAIAFLATVWFIKRAHIGKVMLAILIGALSYSSMQGIFISIAMLVFIFLAGLFKKVKHTYIVMPVLVFISTIAPRLFLSSISAQLTAYEWMLLFVEGILGTVLVLIFMQSMPLLSPERYQPTLKNEEIICMIILIASILTGMIGWEMYGVAFEQVFSRYIVLLLAYVGGAAIGSTVGVVAGLILSLADVANLYQMSLRSEEHTSELQSRGHLVCRLLLEKKKV